MLSPLLFSIFAAAMEVVLQRFSEDDTILEDLVFPDEGRGGGGGRDTAGPGAEGGTENAVCRRCWDRV